MLHVQENIVAQIGGVPVMECKYGVSSGQYALKVENMLCATASEGGKHG